jgi:hypothetical protein
MPFFVVVRKGDHDGFFFETSLFEVNAVSLQPSKIKINGDLLFLSFRMVQITLLPPPPFVIKTLFPLPSFHSFFHPSTHTPNNHKHININNHNSRAQRQTTDNGQHTTKSK